MKKSIIISLYFITLMLILSTNQSGWFQSHPEGTGDASQKKPIFNQAEAYVPHYVLPQKMDPYLKNNWAFKNKSGLEMEKAWKMGTCNKSVVVAVIDTGIDYNHADLKSALWKNKREIPNNGKDDDNNGYIDDMFGWDFVKNDNLPYDDHGHGTHIAGIIGATRNNGVGTSGVCSGVSLMIIKYYDPAADGSTNLENTIKSFEYAVKNGADIINYSGGGAQFSKQEYTAIKAAENKGILVVAAAGNESQDTDQFAYYPASYDLSNILSVAAISEKQTLVASSNYGHDKIDVAAPGHNIYSTLPSGEYGYMTGTSQATAFVSGIAAMALSKNRGLQLKDLKDILINSSKKIQSLSGKIKTGGIISAYSVLKKLERAPLATSETP